MAERQTIAQNLRWLAFGNLAVKPLWFLFLLISVRYLGPEEFGKFMYALSFVSVLAYIFEGGLDAFLMREVARDHTEYGRLFASSATLKIMSGLLVAMVGACSAWVVGMRTDQIVLIAIAGGHPIVNGLMTHIRFAFRGLEVMQYEARSIMVEKVLVLLVCGAVLLVDRNATSLMAGFVAAYAGASVVTLILLHRHVGPPDLKVRWRSLWPNVLKPALPFALMGMFMVVYYRSGTLMLEWITGNATLVGYYSAGYRLVEGFALLPGIIVMPLYATFARSQDDTPAVRRMIPDAARGLLVASALISVPMLVFDEGFTRMLYGEEFLPAASAIGLTVLTMVPVGMTWLFVNLAGAVGRQHILNRWIIGVTTLNLALNYVLITRFGVLGAAWAALLTESAMAASAMWVTRDFIAGGEFLRIAGGIAIPVVVLVGVTRVHLLPGPFLVQVISGLAVMIGGFILLRVVRMSDVRTLLAGIRP